MRSRESSVNASYRRESGQQGLRGSRVDRRRHSKAFATGFFTQREHRSRHVRQHGIRRDALLAIAIRPAASRDHQGSDEGTLGDLYLPQISGQAHQRAEHSTQLAVETVLLVEDEADVLSGAAELFRSVGYEVVTATNEAKAELNAPAS